MSEQKLAEIIGEYIKHKNASISHYKKKFIEVQTREHMAFAEFSETVFGVSNTNSVEKTAVRIRNKIKTDLFSLNIQKNPPSLNVISEENVPDEFYIVERKLQRTELLKAMKAGLEVEGVEIKQGESLRIR